MDKKKSVCENERYCDSEINVYFGSKKKENPTEQPDSELTKDQIKEIIKLGKKLLG